MQKAAMTFLLLVVLTGLGYSQQNPATAKQAKAEAVKIVNAGN